MRLLTMSNSALPLPLSFSATAANYHHYRHHQYVSSVPCMSPYLQIDPQCSSEDSSQHYYQLNSSHRPKTIRYRLSQLCREGQLDLARQLFDEIPQPTTVVWNSMIIGYICNNLHYEAIALYIRMKCGRSLYKFEPDPYTFSSVLKACAEMMEFRVGKAVHCHILRSEINPGRIVYNSLLNMYASCLSTFNTSSSFNLVERVFNTMPKRNVVAWNTMISWYLKVGRPIDALIHFVMMMRTGLKPTVVSFINVFPAASLIGDVHTANVLFGLVMRLGEEYVVDLFVVSSAIYMYTELSCLSIARRIFDNCLERNTEIWNSMIGGYVQNSCPTESLHLFLKALADAVAIDEVTFLSAMNATSQLQHLEFAQQLHAYLIKSSLISRVVILNAMISMYSKLNSINESFHVFASMQEKDLVSWNTMVSALVQNGMDDEGLMLVREMQNQGFMIDAVTITALLSAASNLRDQKIGKQTHAYILRHRIQFEGMNTYLIDMYFKSGIIGAAESVFDMNCSNNRDQATWNAMISGYTHNGLIEQSLAVFRQMLQHNVAPTTVTLSSILPASSQSGSLNLGKQFHCFIIRNFLHDNVFVTSALVDMYSKTGAIHYSERVFQRSPEKNSVTFTNMILGYGQHGMGDKAIMLLNSWREFGFKPDAVTFLATLSACNYSGMVNEGLQVLESMSRDYGLQPLLEHYACVVDMLGRVGRVIEAYDFVKELGDECNILGVWGSLLSACMIHGNFELGKVVADKLLSMTDGDKKTGYHVLLSNNYAAKGNWQLVDMVRRGMRDNSFIKEVGCSWIDISGYAHCFTSRDENHPYCHDIYKILGQLSTNLKDAGYGPSLGLQGGWSSELVE